MRLLRSNVNEFLGNYPKNCRGSGARATLRRNLGGTAGDGKFAHHIVAFEARGAAVARAVLQRFGIDINSAANGILMDASHRGIHTSVYFKAVNELLMHAESRQEVLLVLEFIKQEIINGTFPH